MSRPEKAGKGRAKRTCGRDGEGRPEARGGGRARRGGGADLEPKEKPLPPCRADVATHAGREQPPGSDGRPVGEALVEHAPRGERDVRPPLRDEGPCEVDDAAKGRVRRVTTELCGETLAEDALEEPIRRSAEGTGRDALNPNAGRVCSRRRPSTHDAHRRRGHGQWPRRWDAERKGQRQESRHVSDFGPGRASHDDDERHDEAPTQSGQSLAARALVQARAAPGE